MVTHGIRVRCFTPLSSAYHEKWPDVFAAVPNVGDWVRSRSGHILQVIKIIHTSSDTGVSPHVPDGAHFEPLIFVELGIL